jgi:hypothetical protein
MKGSPQTRPSESVARLVLPLYPTSFWPVAASLELLPTHLDKAARVRPTSPSKQTSTAGLSLFLAIF